MAYKLIAEAGSTKTDWLAFDENHCHYFETSGMNPTTQDPIYLDTILEQAKFNCPSETKSIIFYGAGCNSQSAKNILEALFKKQFPNCTISIDSDILACGRALCADTPGIVAILGTGSHAALCDGHKITDQLPSLGFILGDEASGNYFGKKLLQIYFLNRMAPDLRKQFETSYPELNHDFIYQLYHSHKPAAKLADFARFAIENKNSDSLKHIIRLGIEEFIENRVLIYKNLNIPVHLCGSIGFYLKPEFENYLNQYGLQLGNCSQKLIHLLHSYHLKHETH